MNSADISQNKLFENISNIREWIPNECKIAAVIKGDAYGHGLMEVAVCLEKCDDVHMLVVSSLEEALKVTERVIKKPILILNRIFVSNILSSLQVMSHWQQKRFIRQTVFSVYRAGDLEEFRKLSEYFGQQFTVHIRLDFSSGMRGMNQSQFRMLVSHMHEIQGVSIDGIYAHVYSAYTNEEEARRDIDIYRHAFFSIPENLRKTLLIHLLSSVSYYKYPDSVFDMVRIGASLYGLPVPDARAPNVSPVMSIQAQVVSIAEVSDHAQADYNGYLPRDVRRVALVSLGSWDIPGFFISREQDAYQSDQKIQTKLQSRLVFSGDTTSRCVWIRQHLCRIVGSPCMDTFCVDITGMSDIRPRDTVHILGEKEGIRLSDWLAHANLGFEDCQMLFSGMSRLPKRLV